MEGGPGSDIMVYGYGWSLADQWDFSNFRNMDSYSNYVLTMDADYQAFVASGAATTGGNREYLNIVADGVKGLDVIIKGIVQILKTVPGIPEQEIKRFEALDTTLEIGEKLIKTGAMSDENAKEFVKDGMELAFGEASDAVLALAMGYLTNHLTEMMPGWGRAIPFAAIIATYAASQASDDVGEIVGGAVTEALFAGIDIVKHGTYWFQSGQLNEPDLGSFTSALVYRENLNGLDHRGIPIAGWSNGEYFEIGQVYFYELNDMGRPNQGRIDNEFNYFLV